MRNVKLVTFKRMGQNFHPTVHDWLNLKDLTKDCDEFFAYSYPLSRFNQVEAPCRRPRGRPKKTCKERVNQDIAGTGVKETAAVDRAVCKTVIKSLPNLFIEGTRKRYMEK